jgi:hypothetical protein
MAQNYCSAIGGNTGRNVNCDPIIAEITGMIMVPSTAKITEQDAEDLLGFLIGKAKAATDRWFPLLNIQNVTDNTTEPTDGTLATTQYTRQLVGSKSAYLLEADTSICLAKIWSKYNQYKGGIFIITGDGKVYGRENKADGSLSPFIPFSPLSVYGAVFGDGQNLGTQKIKLSLGDQPKLINTIGFFSFAEDDIIDNIIGLTDVYVKRTAAGTFQVVTGCGGDNLYDSFKSQLSTATLWKLTQQDGTAVSITTVTGDDDTKSFTITPAITAGTYRIGLTDVTALEAAGVVGYENPKPTLFTAPVTP